MDDSSDQLIHTFKHSFRKLKTTFFPHASTEENVAGSSGGWAEMTHRRLPQRLLQLKILFIPQHAFPSELVDRLILLSDQILQSIHDDRWIESRLLSKRDHSRINSKIQEMMMMMISRLAIEKKGFQG